MPWEHECACRNTGHSHSLRIIPEPLNRKKPKFPIYDRIRVFITDPDKIDESKAIEEKPESLEKDTSKN